MPKAASRPNVMNLEIFRRATILAAPIVPRENSLTEISVRFRFEPYPRSSWPQARHGIPLISSSNSSCCSWGSSL